MSFQLISKALFQGLCLCALSSCATIVSGPTQDIVINSNPPGANVEVTNKHGMKEAQGTTPLSVELERKGPRPYKVLLRKDGYEDSTALISKSSWGNNWVFGNLIFGGLIGILVDVVSGSSETLIPAKVNVQMEKKQSTKTKHSTNSPVL